jgi:prepilin-type processing-associated H-X9-DG protein
VVSEPIKTLRCPSDHRTGPEHANWSVYVGIAGVGDDAPALGVKHRRAGVFGHEREVTMRDIKDGQSNTLMFAETTSDNGPWAAGGRATVRGIDPDDESPVSKGGAFGMVHSDTSRNWGSIPVWANVAMADGSVRRLPAKTDAAVMTAIATIAGGEELPKDW